MEQIVERAYEATSAQIALAVGRSSDREKETEAPVSPAS
jgi:hypothetical protein